MKRSSSVVWHGSGKFGKGLIVSQSKAINDAHYAWNTRYENAKGTNPEELLAAAHASCFTMKLSFLIEDAGFKAETIETTSTVSLEKSGITESHLVVKAKVPDMDLKKFEELAEKSKNECPVSRALKINITLESTLVEEVEHDGEIKV